MYFAQSYFQKARPERDSKNARTHFNAKTTTIRQTKKVETLLIPFGMAQHNFLHFFFVHLHEEEKSDDDDKYQKEFQHVVVIVAAAFGYNVTAHNAT